MSASRVCSTNAPPLARGLELSILRARCSELTHDHPFSVVRTLLEPTLVRADEETRAKLMRGPAALAEPVFGPREAFDEYGVIHGLYWLTVNIAEQRPMAILVDDVLWADDFSLRYLAYLADRIDDIPAAMLVAIRHGDPGADSPLIAHLSDAAGGPSIRPANLSETAVHALLTDALPDREVDADLTQTVLAETGGNPYLVVAVADAIRAGDTPGVTAPDSVRRQITRRLSRLHPATQTLATAASVLGDEAVAHRRRPARRTASGRGSSSGRRTRRRPPLGQRGPDLVRASNRPNDHPRHAGAAQADRVSCVCGEAVGRQPN